jgi:hypothetical protein
VSGFREMYDLQVQKVQEEYVMSEQEVTHRYQVGNWSGSKEMYDLQIQEAMCAL